MMWVALAITILIVVIVYQSKIKIDFVSFAMPTLPLAIGVFGVYCFSGKQGSGKTYSLNKFIRKHAKGKKIYSNVTLKNLDYTHLESLDQMLALRDEKDCYIVYDEIFTLLSKTRHLPKDKAEILEEFLTQQRKQRNIFITTAQEWLNIPIDFRRFVRVQVECSTRPLGKLGGILKEVYYDATNMVWDNMQNEYVAPLITTKISKYEKRFMTTYDTEERIRKLN